MSVQTVQALTKKVESLTPVVRNSIVKNQKLSKQFLKQEKDNNQDLFDLLSLSKNIIKQKSQDGGESSSKLIPIIQNLQGENENKDQIINQLVQINAKLKEENDQAGKILKNVDPSALRTALAAAGFGAVLGLPPVLSPDSGPEGAPATAVLTDKGVYYNPLPGGSFKGGADQVFGASRDGGDREHAGIDITESNYDPKSDPRIPVVAVRGGVVISDRYDNTGGYRSGLMVRQDDGYDARYLHMMPSLKPGDKVVAGQKLGRLISLGKGGSNTHLHFELYNSKTKSLLNPTSYIKEIQSGKPIKQTAAKQQPSQQQSLKPPPTSTQQRGVTPTMQAPRGVNRSEGSVSSLPPTSQSSNPLLALQLHKPQ
ncbi:endolysin [Synechococcus phage DSL-LC02]|nr:endolysin [Synechococcus phage DSL-LC02]